MSESREPPMLKLFHLFVRAVKGKQSRIYFYPIYSLKLTLLSVPPGEASRLDPDDDQFYDYTDKAPVNVKVPVYSYSADNSFVQFHIHLNDELVSMRRYSEFIALQAQIQRLFPDLVMPRNVLRLV